jgi:two-component system phosphate regulon sensor histidine kinase PhoR
MKPLLIFYILVAYIMLQFSWWAYLLSDLEKSVYLHKIENVSLLKNAGKAHDQEPELQRKLNKRLYMIAGEGSVFLLILGWGIYKTRNAFLKEVSLARQQKNFLLSITHEFKSPLASVKLYLQTLQKRELDKSQKESFIKNAIKDVDRLNGLVENALFATQIERKTFSINKESGNISEMMEDLVKTYSESPVRNVSVRSDIAQGVVLKIDKIGFTSMLNNIFENAVKYSPPDAEVFIELKETSDKAIIRIADHGPGIPEQEKSRIFEKFYRIGNEETRKYKGTGLGLYIAAYICELHHGKMIVKDQKPSGSIFEIRLPKMNSV